MILCIGNRHGGDDSFGPYISDQLTKKNPKDIKVIDCGTNPENYTSYVKKIKPKNVVLIDAVEMGIKPGEIRLIPPEKISEMHVSTHGIPLSVIIKYIQLYVEKVTLIGIQPKKIQGEISLKIKEKANILIRKILEKEFFSIKSI
ncbi:MAG: hydrogenase 3 maturation endopeptidase HyCI [Candidatus Thermoplasmatota archaeon]